MKESQAKLVISSLLHDIGKLTAPSRDRRTCRERGVRFLQEAGLTDPEILHSIRYCSRNLLEHTPLPEADPACLVWYADRTAAAAERRQTERKRETYDRTVPLASIFNLLNGNREEKFYEKTLLGQTNAVTDPTDAPGQPGEAFWQEILCKIASGLRGLSLTEDSCNTLLGLLEETCSFLPAYTGEGEATDLSLYDQAKLTAALAQAASLYLAESGEQDIRSFLLAHTGEADERKMFLLYSMDISGIQKFIYTIRSAGALKGLRTRSFYLEILMEHMIDEVLTACGLSRASLIYSGGGHCYLLLPNTRACRENLAALEERNNAWFLEQFDIALYVAGGYAACSARDLRNDPEGSYAALYAEISKCISDKKNHRYSAEQIFALNRRRHTGERECRVCQRRADLNQEDLCPVCAGLEQMSAAILYDPFFAVTREPRPGSLPLPGGVFLSAMKERALAACMEGEAYIRSYSKNCRFAGRYGTTRIWIGDYSSHATLNELSGSAVGIRRIAILRADVDNLGRSFVHGFERPDGSQHYVSLSRTAAFSRRLSIFFKFYINGILEHGKADLLETERKRKITIVYSGGDDLFLAGAWNDVIAAAADLRNALAAYTQNTLTLSGGIGIYQENYPVQLMAGEVGALEECSKKQPGKNAVTLFDPAYSYGWEVFLQDVLKDKYETVRDYFDRPHDYGIVCLYRLLGLMRDSEDKIQTARFVYTLAKLEPPQNAPQDQIDAYRDFAGKLYRWMQDPEDRRKAITAMYLYAYLRRKEENVYGDETDGR